MSGKMEFELSNHAATRIRQRRIEMSWIEMVLSCPELVEEDLLDPALEHRLASVSEARHDVLRVVCNPAAEPILVITAFFDDGMKGKL